MLTAQPLHAPAFLVDQDRRIVAAHTVTQAPRQLTQLIRRAAIAREQDETPRLRLAEKRLFRGAQLMAVATENNRLCGHGMPTPSRAGRTCPALAPPRLDHFDAMMQACPVALSCSHTSAAAALSAKPPTRRRYQVPLPSICAALIVGE